MLGAVALITIGAFENLAATTILPVIATELDGFDLYALAAGLPLALQVVAAALGGLLIDRISFQRPLWIGVVIAALGLTMAGFAPAMWLLALGRGVAGFGFGMMIVAIYAAVGLAVPAHKRPGLFAAFSAAWVIPGMVGPLIAGLLADIGQWRLVLLGPVPFLLLGLVPMRTVLRMPVTASADLAALRKRAMVVAPAAAGLAVGLAIVQFAGGSGDRWLALGGFAVVLALLPLLLPKGTATFRRGVPAAVAARFFVNAGVIAMETYIAMFLQVGRGWSPSLVGLVLAASSISWALGSYVQSRLVGEETRYRWAVAGSVLVAIGIALTTIVVLPGVPTMITPFAWFVAGFGMGITFAALSVFALGATPQSEQGAISASLQVADATGAALSIAIAGALISAFQLADSGFGAAFGAMFLAALLGVVATIRVRKVTAPAVHGEEPSP